MHVQKNTDGGIALLASTLEERDLVAEIAHRIGGNFEHRAQQGLLIIRPLTCE